MRAGLQLLPVQERQLLRALHIAALNLQTRDEPRPECSQQSGACTAVPQEQHSQVAAKFAKVAQHVT